MPITTCADKKVDDVEDSNRACIMRGSRDFDRIARSVIMSLMLGLVFGAEECRELRCSIYELITTGIRYNFLFCKK